VSDEEGDMDPRAGVGRSAADYAVELARNGTRVVLGGSGTLWISHEWSAMVRFPVFTLAPPSRDEVRRVLWRGPAAVASYLIEPNAEHPANAYLYVCEDREYSLDKLSPAVRRNVRRGLGELRITWVDGEDVIAKGFEAYRDWIRRVGLGEASLEQFRRHMESRASCAAHLFLGAWKESRLVSFLTITEVDDWVEIDGCFSGNASLNLRPNETLFFHVLSHYLREKRFRAVSYGVSSLQAESNKDGLHIFKTKIGFEAKPVRRVLALHPVLRPLANRAILWGLNAALACRPKSRRLKKAEGLLATLLGEDRLPKSSSAIT
jgi:hypothetical protein